MYCKTCMQAPLRTGCGGIADVQVERLVDLAFHHENKEPREVVARRTDATLLDTSAFLDGEHRAVISVLEAKQQGVRDGFLVMRRSWDAATVRLYLDSQTLHRAEEPIASIQDDAFSIGGG